MPWTKLDTVVAANPSFSHNIIISNYHSETLLENADKIYNYNELYIECD